MRTRMIALILGTAALTLAGLNWHIGVAAWLAPAFLLYYTRNSKWKGFILLIACMSVAGAVSQTGNNVFDIFLLNIINGLTYGIFYSFSYIIDKLLYRQKERILSTLIFPSAMVIFEFIGSSVFGTWGIVAHTQYPNLVLMQMTSLTGIFGLSFLVCWFGSLINFIMQNRNSGKLRKQAGLIYGGILIAILIYGTARIGLVPETSESVKIAALSSNTNLHAIVEREQDSLQYLIKHPDTKLPDRIFSSEDDINNMLKLSVESCNQGARIIAWNEDALILNQEQKNYLLKEAREICIENECYLLLAILEKNAGPLPLPFNNISILLTPEGNIAWEYAKSYLHPYAETPIINAGNYELPVIETEFGNIGNVICADMDKTRYIAQAGKKAVDILFVPAFDWEGITPLHPQMSVIEAIQNGFSVVRPNGSGLSVAYDCLGREIASMNTYKTEQQILLFNLPLHSCTSLYAKSGNFIIWLASMVLGFFIIMLFISPKKKK